MNTFEIHNYVRSSSGEKVACVEFKEPEIGAWYCGFIRGYYTDPEPGLPSDLDGDIAQYTGNGVFISDRWDGVNDPEVDMGGYDYLVKQG